MQYSLVSDTEVFLLLKSPYEYKDELFAVKELIELM